MDYLEENENETPNGGRAHAGNWIRLGTGPGLQAGFAPDPLAAEGQDGAGCRRRLRPFDETGRDGQERCVRNPARMLNPIGSCKSVLRIFSIFSSGGLDRKKSCSRVKIRKAACPGSGRPPFAVSLFDIVRTAGEPGGRGARSGGAGESGRPPAAVGGKAARGQVGIRAGPG